MVEINNQRKAFLDMLAWSEGIDNGRQKTRKSWLWRHCRRRAIYWLPDHPRKLVTLNPKLKSTGAGRYQLLSRWWMPTAKQLTRRDLSPKSQDAVALQQRLRERRFYLWLIVVDIRQAPTVGAISGLHCRALVMVSSSIRLTAWIAKFSSGRNGQRDWCMSRVTAIISALVICIIVCLSWAVNHYRDNAIAYKAQRDKNARELKRWTRYIDMQMASPRDVAALDAKNTREGVSWC